MTVGPPGRVAYFGRLGARWLRALAAAVFDALLVRPSLSTFDAADAAFALVFLALVMRPPSSRRIVECATDTDVRGRDPLARRCLAVAPLRRWPSPKRFRARSMPARRLRVRPQSGRALGIEGTSKSQVSEMAKTPMRPFRRSGPGRSTAPSTPTCAWMPSRCWCARPSADHAEVRLVDWCRGSSKWWSCGSGGCGASTPAENTMRSEHGSLVPRWFLFAVGQCSLTRLRFCRNREESMIRDERWPVARLIPISSASGIEAQERRVTSALLAVLTAVDEYGRSLLRPFGAPAGKVEAFIEVPFHMNGKEIRPDGLVVVTKGARTWSAIVEAKTGTNALDIGQVERYLDLAREFGFDALLTISNHYVTSSSPYPVSLDRKKLKKVALHHWSWIDVLTEAVIQKRFRGVKDPDQAYILGELIRYLSDARSGVLTLADMGPDWTTIREGARDQTLKGSDPAVEAIALRWDDLVRYLSLELTKELGHDVRQSLPRAEQDPVVRIRNLKESLAESGRLYAEISVPDSAGSLEVVADLRSRRITVGTRVDAPRDGRSKGRVSWLLRQLQKAPDQVKVDARITYSPSGLTAMLAALRERPELLYAEKGKEIRQFTLSLSRDMGLKRDASRGSFITSVISTTKDFYAGVLQNLGTWKARPPKLPSQAPLDEVVAHAAEVQPELAEPLVDAVEESFTLRRPVPSVPDPSS